MIQIKSIKLIWVFATFCHQDFLPAGPCKCTPAGRYNCIIVVTVTRLRSEFEIPRLQKRLKLQFFNFGRPLTNFGTAYQQKLNILRKSKQFPFRQWPDKVSPTKLTELWISLHDGREMCTKTGTLSYLAWIADTAGTYHRWACWCLFVNRLMLYSFWSVLRSYRLSRDVRDAGINFFSESVLIWAWYTVDRALKPRAELPGGLRTPQLWKSKKPGGFEGFTPKLTQTLHPEVFNKFRSFTF